MTDEIALPEGGMELVSPAVETPAEKLRRTPTPGTQERTEYDRLAQQRSRQRRADRQSVESLKFTSKIEVTKSDALELLAQRIRNRQVCETAYKTGIQCAAATGIFPNRFFWAHGFQKLLESQQAHTAKFLEIDRDQTIPSEVIHRSDAYAIWDFSVSYREPDVTFADFVEMRRMLKSDWFILGQFLGIPFEPKPHRGWEQFLPQFLPSLQPGYTMQDMKSWLAAQKSATYEGTTRDWLLMASRNTMKSTAGLTLSCQAVLCAPSLRILLVSETTKLSKDFVRAFRGFWELGSSPAYDRFQYYFPEYCIEQGDGSVLSFTSPMRNFVLPQETAEPASVEMATAGRRFDVGIFDDNISDRNTGSHEMRTKILNVYDALLKLREANAGLTITIGTPWVCNSMGEIGDLYFELMKRNDNDPDHPLAVKIEPAWILKPEVAHKFPDHLNQIIEDDVQELTCPSRWPFKALMKEARANITMFMSQNLVMYVESQESRWTPTFTLEQLQAAVRPINFFNGVPVLFTCAAVDTAFSLSERADRSSILIAKILQYDGKNVGVVWDVIVGRWKYSDLAVQIVDAFQRHGVQRAVIERNGAQWTDLQSAILRNSVIKNYPVPMISWKLSTGTGMSGVSAKVQRIKGAEVLFNNGQIYFSQGPWNEGLFAETVRFKGQRSGSSIGSKDDQVESLGQMCEAFLVKDTGLRSQTKDQIEFEQEMYGQQALRAQYANMFGSQMGRIPVAQPDAEPEPESARDHYFGNLNRR